MRSSLLLALAALALSVAHVTPAAAATPWRATAVDADRDGRVDAVQMRGVPRGFQHCKAWKASGLKVTKVVRGAHGRVTLRVREGKIDTALRPVVSCAGSTSRERAADGAAPVPVSAKRTGAAQVSVRFSEPVKRRRASAVAVVNAAGQRTGAQAAATAAPAAGLVVSAPAASAAPVKVILGTGAVGDTAGNASESADLSLAGYPSLPAVTPGSATAFADSVGVNVHLSYFDTAYNDFTTLKQKLLDSGIRRIRDSACAGCVEQQNRLLALGAAGVKADFIMRQPGSPDSMASLVGLVAGRLRSMVASVEGANEFDLSGQADWTGKLRSWQQDLYTRVKADPRLAGVPVLGPSLVWSQDYAAAGDLSQYMDCGNIHPYSGGAVPTASLAGNLASLKITSSAKPVCATEAGYTNAVATTGGHLPASEKAAAAYVPRLFLDFFSRGVRSTYLYELVDERPDPSNRDAEQHFGLLRSDYSEKPAFTTLKRLLQLVRPDQQATPAALRYTATGPSDLRQLLLQQDAHHQVLVLWRDLSVYDPSARQDLSPRNQNVTVNFGQPVSRAVIDVLDGNPSQPLHDLAAPRQLVGPIGAMPVVVRLTLP
jgi:hypothetical protein